MMRWLDYVCTARNDSACETVIIGKSSEQRDLKVIKVRTSSKHLNYDIVLSRLVCLTIIIMYSVSNISLLYAA